jgi:flagellar motor switch/type III secretory pathway protein FliN
MDALTATNMATVSAGTDRPGDNWDELQMVKTTVAVEVAIPNLTVRDLFRLEVGSVLATAHLSGTNVPLLIGRRTIASGEFQVSGDTLGLRVAEMA